MSGRFFIGLMTGTSADAIDTALVEFFSPIATAPPYAIRATHAVPLSPSLRQRAIAFNDAGDALRWADWVALDHDLAGEMAQAVHELLHYSGLARRQITALGMHGQTVYHRPVPPHPKTVQLGNAARLAALTGIPVVSDFRAADVAHGGQGAPLAPLFQRYFLQRRVTYPVAVVNLGGIANVSLLHAEPTRDLGFDTGPANALMDHWIHAVHGLDYDADGAFARSGRVIPALLAAMTADPYFALPAPKSTGRDYFSAQWLANYCAALPTPPAPADVQATLLELTAQTVAASLKPWAIELSAVLIAGGGVRNGALMARLRGLLQCPVASMATVGLPPDDLEALGFAWLAKQHVDRQPLPLKAITGASKDAIAGAYYPTV